MPQEQSSEDALNKASIFNKMRGVKGEIGASGPVEKKTIIENHSKYLTQTKALIDLRSSYRHQSLPRSLRSSKKDHYNDIDLIKIARRTEIDNVARTNFQKIGYMSVSTGEAGNAYDSIRQVREKANKEAKVLPVVEMPYQKVTSKLKGRSMVRNLDNDNKKEEKHVCHQISKKH